MASLEPRTIIKNRDFYNHMIDFLTQTKNLFANSSSSSNPFYISQTNYNKLKSKLPNITVYRTYFKHLLYSDAEIMDIKDDEAFHNEEEKNALRQHVIQYYPSDLTPSHNTNNYNFSLFNDIYTRFRFFKIAYYKDIDNPNILSHYIEPVEPTRSFVTGYGFFRACGIAGTYTSELWSNAEYPSSAATINENKYGLVPVLTQAHGGTLPDEFRGTQGQYNLGLLTNQNPDSRFILKKWIGGDDGKSVWYRYDVLANKLNSGNDSLKNYKSSFDSYISELAASQHKVIKAEHANRLIAKSDELANSALHPFANYYYLLFSNLCIRQGIKARLVFHPASNTTYTDRNTNLNTEISYYDENTKKWVNCYQIDLDIFSDWQTLIRNTYTFQHYDSYFKNTNFERASTETFCGWTTYTPTVGPQERSVQRNCNVGNSFVLLADYTYSNITYHFYPVMYEPLRIEIRHNANLGRIHDIASSPGSVTSFVNLPNNSGGNNSDEKSNYRYYYIKRHKTCQYYTYKPTITNSYRQAPSGNGTYFREENLANGSFDANNFSGSINFNSYRTVDTNSNDAKNHESIVEADSVDKSNFSDLTNIYKLSIYFRVRVRKIVIKVVKEGVKKQNGKLWDALDDRQKELARQGRVIACYANSVDKPPTDCPKHYNTTYIKYDGTVVEHGTDKVDPPKQGIATNSAGYKHFSSSLGTALGHYLEYVIPVAYRNEKDIKKITTNTEFGSGASHYWSGWEEIKVSYNSESSYVI